MIYKVDDKKKKRVPIISEAVIMADSKGPLIEGYLINISYGGAGIYAKEPLDGRVQMAISLIDSSGKKVVEAVWGRVTWKKSIGLMYALGISFEGLNPKSHTMLLSFLERATTVYEPI